MTMGNAVPLTERAELASAQWLDLAEAFFANVGALSGIEGRFTLSAAYENPPPHLARDSTPPGFTIVFSADGAKFDKRPNADAAWFRASDYNAALPFLWIVYEDNPDATRLEAEYQRLFGAGFGSIKSSTPVPNEVQSLMGAFHNHMARRTINNPDIEHRAKHFGLTSHLRDLDTHGYTIMEQAFSSDYADALRAETAHNHAGRDDGASFRATMLLKRGRIWEEAAYHPWVLTVVEWLLGRGALMYQSDTIVKSTGQETHPGLHSDYAASRITEPFPDFCMEGTAVWAIDDFRKEHGPTCVLPGSVDKRRQVPAGTTQDGTKLLEMDCGSIAFWHGALWHGSTPRTAPGKRSSLHNAYCRNFVRPLENYADIDSVIVARNPPVFATLCGLDDAFGKSGNEGADFERLGYANAQGFASSNTPVMAAKS